MTIKQIFDPKSSKLLIGLGLVSALSLNSVYAGNADRQCKNLTGGMTTIAPKTITIKNNSEKVIYPVFTASNNEVNEWIQACFRTADPNPTKYIYKIYINEGVGLAQGEEATVTLPLYSNIGNMQGLDKYITWWNGGRIVIATTNPLTEEYKKNDVLLGSMPPDLSCDHCTLSVYASKTQFAEDLPAQLSEFTFGGVNPPPGETLKLLNPDNVGYNISYVDHIYLPIAIGPKGNRYIGYSGSGQSLIDFTDAIKKFLAVGGIGEEWPVYNMDELKIPSTYNVFAQRTGYLKPSETIPVLPKKPPVLTLLRCIEHGCSEQEMRLLRFGKSVQRIQDLWGSCHPFYGTLRKEITSQYKAFNDKKSTKPACPESIQKDFATIHDFFQANFANYVKDFQAGKCNLDPNVKAYIPFTPFEAIKHIYGWVPFNDGCGAGANALAGKDGDEVAKKLHAQMQSLYIHDMQYDYVNDKNIKPEDRFNPYVQLVHDYLKMDAYAFSVDDAVGFMSELGQGLIVTVGGTDSLENKLPFSYKNGFMVKVGIPKQLETSQAPFLKSYGACEDTVSECKQDMILPTNTQLAGFRIGTIAKYPVKIAFTDVDGNVYSFTVTESFEKFPANRTQLVSDCKVTKNGTEVEKSGQWCRNVDPNAQVEKQLTKYYLSFPVPVKYL